MLSWSRTFVTSQFYAEIAMQDFEALAVYVRSRTSRRRIFVRACLLGASLTVGVRRAGRPAGVSIFDPETPMFVPEESDGQP